MPFAVNVIALWLVNQLWFIVPVNHAKIALLLNYYIKAIFRPKVSMVYRLINHLGCWYCLIAAEQFAAQIKLGYLSCLKLYSLLETQCIWNWLTGSNISLVNKFNYAINFQFVWKPVMSGMEKTCWKFDVSDIFPVHTQMYAQHVYKKLRLLTSIKTFANPYNKRHLIKLFLDSSRQNYKTSKNTPVRWFSTWDWEWADWSLVLKFSSACVSWSKQMNSLDDE